MWFKQCIHDWKVLHTTIRKAMTFDRIKGVSEDVLERMTGGSTSVLLSCSKCGKTEVHVMSGSS